MESIKMKNKTLIFAAGAALAVAMAPACGPVDDEPGTGDGDMGGDSGDGDGDGDGDMGGDGGDGDGMCSDEVTSPATGGAGGASAASCEEPALPENDIEISGDYADDFGGPLSFTNEGLDQGGDMLFFTKIDNENNFAIGINSESALFNACAWSVIAWHEEDDVLYFCQEVFSAPSECDAVEAELPDPTDLDGGCGGMFAWSVLTPAE
jgi:hypothetical protein